MAPTLPQRKLGSQGCVGSALGLGCMSLTKGFYGANVDEKETEPVLRRALDLGVTLINTADFYGPIANHELIARVIKDYPRERVVIASKWGPWMDGKNLSADFRPKTCKDRLDASLKRLGVEYIDLLVLRFRGPSNDFDTSLEETAKAMKELVDEGKVKYIGLSEATPEQIRTVHAITPVTALEMEWSLFSRDGEAEVVPLARELGIGFMAYSPIGRGALTDNFDPNDLDATDFRKKNPRFTGEAFENNMKLAKSVKDLAAKKGCTTAQLALAWVLAQGDDVIPIPGTKRVKYLEENLKALEVKLTPEEVKELSNVISPDAVTGSRY